MREAAAGLSERHPRAAATGRAPTARSDTRRRVRGAPRPGGRRRARSRSRPAGRRRSRCRPCPAAPGWKARQPTRASSRHAATRRGSVPPTGSQRSDQRTRSTAAVASSRYTMLEAVVDDAPARPARAGRAHSRGRGGRASPWNTVRRRAVHRSPPGHLSSPACPLTGKRILVTGGAGFIGTTLARSPRRRERGDRGRQPPPRRAVGHGARGRTRTSASSRATCSTWRS